MEAFALRSGAAALVVFGNQVEGLPVPVVGRVLFPGWIKGGRDGRS
jgi:hypothetical protein